MEQNKNFLKERAAKFWQLAEEKHQQKEFNMSALFTEQAVQLFTKHLIYAYLGEFPKTHLISELIESLAEAHQKPAIMEFYRQHSNEFLALEDAYITSRYIPREFNQSEADGFIRLANQYFSLLDKECDEQII